MGGKKGFLRQPQEDTTTEALYKISSLLDRGHDYFNTEQMKDYPISPLIGLRPPTSLILLLLSHLHYNRLADWLICSFKEETRPRLLGWILLSPLC